MGVIIGSLLCVLGGIGVGTFLLPLKLSKSWKWENSWLVAVFLMYCVFPVLALAVLVPEAREIYGSTPFKDLLMIYIFGLIQGTGALVFTYGTTLMGISLGYALMIGAISSVSLLVPLFGAHIDRLNKLDGITLIIGCAILLVGIAVSGKAGVLRERGRVGGREKETGPGARRLNFGLVALVVVWAGIANSLFYFTFEFQKSMKHTAIEQYHVQEHFWGFLNMLPFLLGMFTINLVLLVVKMVKDGSLKNYWSGAGLGKEYLLAFSIALLWYLGQGVAYTAGFTMLGPLGVAIGAALFMGTMMVASNVVGVRTGEWVKVQPGTLRILYVGLFCLIVAMVVISVGNYLQQNLLPAAG